MGFGASRTARPTGPRLVIAHLVPCDAKWWYVFGSATLCAFVIQVIQRIVLELRNKPATPEFSLLAATIKWARKELS